MSGSFLRDKELADAAVSGTSFVDPLDADAIRSASIDLRISNQRYEYLFGEHTLGNQIADEAIRHSDFDEIWLEPGQSAYIGLLEKINIPIDMLGFVFPRSTLTRLGVAIFPVYMNPGYQGVMPITITNNGHVRIKIVPGVRVAQLLCARLSGPAMTGYGDQTAAKYYQERVAAAKSDEEDLPTLLDKILKARMPNLISE
jgi:dCTP deaminase